jgi:hypothetical protein
MQQAAAFIAKAALRFTGPFPVPEQVIPEHTEICARRTQCIRHGWQRLIGNTAKQQILRCAHAEGAVCDIARPRNFAFFLRSANRISFPPGRDCVSCRIGQETPSALHFSPSAQLEIPGEIRNLFASV